MVLVAYLLVAMARLVLAAEIVEWHEIVVIVGAILALQLLRSGRTRAATVVLTATVATDIHVSYFVNVSGLHDVTHLTAVVFVIGVGLVLGSRAATVSAALLSLTIPATLVFSEWVGVGAGITREGAFVVCILVTLLNGCAFLISRVLDSLQRATMHAYAIVEALPDGVIAVDSAGRVRAINARAERLLEQPREALVGVTLHQHPKIGWIHDALAIEGVGLALETPSGSILEATGRSLPTGTATFSAILVLRDITSSKRSEQRHTELLNRLHHAQKLEAVGRLAGGIAHDFNNLLTAVGSHADALVMSGSGESEEVGHELRAVRSRGSALTGQLLAFARREVVQPRRADLAAIVRGLELLLRRLLGERIELVMRADEICPVVADPGHLEQVIINLVSNARDAMPDGGKLQIECRAEVERIQLKVADSGGGMDEETRARIFEPFFTTKGPGEGTGLGLATAHGLITQYGGRVEVSSEIGRGTQFVISWPRGPQPSVPVRAPSVAPAERGSAARILLVEDDNEARRGLSRLLRRAGYEVIEARLPSEALAKAAEQAPSLLLSDMVMPEMSGIELAAHWREAYPDRPVLFMSGYSEEALDLELGEGELLKKPFTHTELVRRIEAKLHA